MENHWGKGPKGAGDELDHLVYLSHLIGREPRLVQRGGGNTSLKIRVENPFGEVEDILVVKESGGDLQTIGREGFTHLSLRRLSALRGRKKMSDEAMMGFMSSCMLYPHRDPGPSVETPLHAILPFRVIVHTHDVATMSLTNIEDDLAGKIIKDLFGGELFYATYARPGFPLARFVIDMVSRIPARATGMALAHHGLVAWGEDPENCYRRLLGMITRIDDFLEGKKKGRKIFGPGRASRPTPEARETLAELLLPVIRGALGDRERVVLHWDGSERVLETLASDRFEELSRKGMATPEHILRAGRLPLWLDLDLDRPAGELIGSVGEQMEQGKRRYLEYHRRNAPPGKDPIPDWAKVILIPGVGMVTGFRDKRSALVANHCYHAVIETIENAEALGGFRFLPEPEVFSFEYWILERRKVDELIREEKKRYLVSRQIVLIIGGGSGIGEAAAWRFAEEGAHVVVSDLEGKRARKVAEAIRERFPHRAVSAEVDVREESSIAAGVRAAVLEFGGLDCLFYTAGLTPTFAPLSEVRTRDLQDQLDIHYLGAILAIRDASRVLRRQGTGGSIICSVSKAGLAPGRQAAAYGGSKAALQHALRTAALELGPSGIRVNSINADQIETPMFLRFAESRARSAGRSLEEQLRVYRERNALRVSLIPPRAVAELAVLLASDRFRYTTGDILTIDGGLPEAFPR